MVICYVSLRPAFQAVTVVMSRPIEQAVKMELGSWQRGGGVSSGGIGVTGR